MFFTLIIPAYNCQNTIDRLLKSIINQDFNDFEVLIIDDSDEAHAHLYDRYIKKYEDKLVIEYYPRRTEINGEVFKTHCPGNTRYDGLDRALQRDSEYIFFADCDDEFEPNTFKKIHDSLLEYPETINVLLTPFFMWKEDGSERMTLEKNNIGWLHGKFYNREFLKRNNIQFKIDLTTHEDVYFNTLASCYLTKENTDFRVLDYITYKWYHRSTSESHLVATLTGQNFLEAHFKDYVEAVTIPVCRIKEEDPQHETNHGIAMINNIVTTYFYFQGFLSNGKIEYLKPNYEICKWQLRLALQTFKYTKDTIIALVYDHKEVFNTDRIECIKGVGYFVETQSFADYLRDMKLYE